MQRTLTKDTVNKVGEEVLLKGWVHVRRDMGKIIFIDLRDASGLIDLIVRLLECLAVIVVVLC